jgi:hypothetical protein
MYRFRNNTLNMVISERVNGKTPKREQRRGKPIVEQNGKIHMTYWNEENQHIEDNTQK